VIRDGALIEPDPTEMLEWARQQRELEEFLEALEEEKEEGGDEGEGRTPEPPGRGRGAP
jgi:hypothetical protein